MKAEKPKRQRAEDASANDKGPFQPPPAVETGHANISHAAVTLDSDDDDDDNVDEATLFSKYVDADDGNDPMDGLDLSCIIPDGGRRPRRRASVAAQEKTRLEITE